MSRLLFPEDRTAFVHQGPNLPILTPPRTAFQVYLDEQATELADITELDGAPITNSIVYTATNGLIGEFYGPDDAVRLWVRVVGSGDPLFPVVCQYSELLDRPTPGDPTAGLIATQGRPEPQVGTRGAWAIDKAAARLYGPRGDQDWPLDFVALGGEPYVPPPEAPKAHVHEQNQASNEWVMDHPLPFKPNITILDSFGQEVEGDVEYPSGSRVVARFNVAFSGRAIMS